MTRTPQFLVLANPHSGQYQPEALEKALQRHADANQIDWVCDDDLETVKKQLQQKLTSNTYKTLIVAGGDGTVKEAITALRATPKTQMAIIPTGTGNLLAKSLHIPENIDEAIDIAITGEPKTLPLGISNNHYFTLVTGVGIDADIMADTQKDHKKTLGMLAYVLTGINKVLENPTYTFKLNIDGHNIETTGTSILLINRKTFLNTLLPFDIDREEAPFFDICVLKADHEFDYMVMLYELLTQSFEQGNAQKIEYYSGFKVQIDSHPKGKVQIDGDYDTDTPVTVSISDRVVTVMAPKQSKPANPITAPIDALGKTAEEFKQQVETLLQI